MSRYLAGALALAFLVLGACSQPDQEKARQREAEAKQKVREGAQRARADAQKLGESAKRQADSFGQSVDHALHDSAPASPDTTGAEQKLKDGGHDLRVEGGKAGVKLDHAALIAKVKAKLATDVGLSTVTGVDVDASGQVVTLRGTVKSEEQKQQAEQSVLAVSGVTRVVNRLTVQP